MARGVTMRRRDREVTDPARVAEIIHRCTCCRIGFIDDGDVYIVPLHFGYERKEDTYVFYFHGAKEGRKVNLTGRCPNVGFEMDTGYALQGADRACDYSAWYQSVIGNGTLGIVSGPEEKKRGLSLLMEHTTGKQDWDFDEKMLDSVLVFKLVVHKMCCKAHKSPELPVSGQSSPTRA